MLYPKISTSPADVGNIPDNILKVVVFPVFELETKNERSEEGRDKKGMGGKKGEENIPAPFGPSKQKR